VTSVGSICTCRFCGEDKSPQGITNHERHCDENPNPGVPFDFQKEQGLLPDDFEREGAADGSNPDPTQDNNPPGGLPPREIASSEKTVRGLGDSKSDEGSEVAQCPVCGHEDVLSAQKALDEYRKAVEHPLPKAVLAYQMADECCNNPTCAALWGDEYHEPLPMGEVLS